MASRPAAALHVVADGGALRVRERRRIRHDQQLEAIQTIRRQKSLVHVFERHARLDQRVIHAEHVILGAIPLRHTRVIGGRLLRVQDRHARQRHLVPQIPLVTVVPVVDPFDHRQPSSVVEHAGEFRDPRAHAVGRPFGDPEPNLRFALHGILPAAWLFQPTLKMPPIGRRPITARYSLARRPFIHGAVTPRLAW